MIPRGVDIFVGLDPIDLRWGFERLSGIVQERMGRSCRSGALFVFFGRRCESMKIVFYDGSGLCIFYKRLDKGRYRMPKALDERATTIEIDERVLEDLGRGGPGTLIGCAAEARHDAELDADERP